VSLLLYVNLELSTYVPRKNRPIGKKSLTELREIAKGQMYTLASLMQTEKTETEAYEKLREEFAMVQAMIEIKKSLKKSKQRYR